MYSERIGLIRERMLFVYGISKQVRYLHSGGVIGLSENGQDIKKSVQIYAYGQKRMRGDDTILTCFLPVYTPRIKAMVTVIGG